MIIEEDSSNLHGIDLNLNEKLDGRKLISYEINR